MSVLSIRKSLLIFLESAAISVIIFTLVAISFIQDEIVKDKYTEIHKPSQPSIYSEKNKLTVQNKKELKL